MTEESAKTKSRRGRKPGRRAQRSKNSEEEKKTQHCVVVIYEDPHGNVQENICQIDDSDYDDRVGYANNIESFIMDVSDSGGMWIDSEMAIPYHMIRAFKRYRGPYPPKKTSESNNTNNSDESSDQNGTTDTSQG